MGVASSSEVDKALASTPWDPGQVPYGHENRGGSMRRLPHIPTTKSFTTFYSAPQARTDLAPDSSEMALANWAFAKDRHRDWWRYRKTGLCCLICPPFRSGCSGVPPDGKTEDWDALIVACEREARRQLNLPLTQRCCGVAGFDLLNLGVPKVDIGFVVMDGDGDVISRNWIDKTGNLDLAVLKGNTVVRDGSAAALKSQQELGSRCCGLAGRSYEICGCLPCWGCDCNMVYGAAFITKHLYLDGALPLRMPDGRIGALAVHGAGYFDKSIIAAALETNWYMPGENGVYEYVRP